MTWSKADAPNTNWYAVTSSADGTKLASVVLGGGIYISQTTPSPQMNIKMANSQLKLSWIVPSTNFILQSSADLSSWKDLTNQPILNLTNLQDEVYLPPTGNIFFRLKTP
jgi:hypothetical protein